LRADERTGILTLADKLRNICFVQGLCSDRIQTIVRSRNHSSFDDIAKTTLEEESLIFFRKMKDIRVVMQTQKVQSAVTNKLGHVASRCYLKDRKETRINQLWVFFLLWRCDPMRVMAFPFLRFLDHTQRRTTVGRTSDQLVAETFS